MDRRAPEPSSTRGRGGTFALLGAAVLASLTALFLYLQHGQAPNDAGANPTGASSATSAPIVPILTDRLVVAGALPETLDPAFARGVHELAVALDLFEGPLVLAPDGGPPRPGLAERYDVSADGLVYVFHLRRDARWSDGVPVTAEDVVAGVRRVLNPSTGSRLAGRLDALDGPNAIRSIDPYTLRVRLSRPVAYFPWIAAGPAFLPVPRQVLARHGDAWWRPPNLVTNGAFTVQDWRPRVRLLLRRAPLFHGREAVRLIEVTLLHVVDRDTAVRMFDAGEVDWVSRDVPRDRVRRARREGDQQVRTVPSLCVYWLELQTHAAPLDDVRVRRALSALIDRRRLAEETIGMGQEPARCVVPPALGAGSKTEPPRGAGYDPEMGRALLSEAGFPEGAGLPALTLTQLTSPAHAAVVAAVVDQLHAGGVADISPRPLEWGAFMQARAAGDFTLAATRWCADYPDPTAFLTPFETGSPENVTAFSDPAFDQLMAEADALPAGARRDRAIADAVRILSDQVPVIPLFVGVRVHLLREDIEGFGPNPLGIHLLRYLRRGGRR